MEWTPRVVFVAGTSNQSGPRRKFDPQLGIDRISVPTVPDSHDRDNWPGHPRRAIEENQLMRNETNPGAVKSVYLAAEASGAFDGGSVSCGLLGGRRDDGGDGDRIRSGASTKAEPGVRGKGGAGPGRGAESAWRRQARGHQDARRVGPD